MANDAGRQPFDSLLVERVFGCAVGSCEDSDDVGADAPLAAAG
jgi:hypothetical protein